jgi:hypothetical protein
MSRRIAMIVDDTEVKVTTKFRCSVCGKVYETKEAAEQGCGVLVTEEPLFVLGDDIRKHTGGLGTIDRVEGPVIGYATSEPGTRTNELAHVYRYRVYRISVDYRRGGYDTFFAHELTRE